MRIEIYRITIDDIDQIVFSKENDLVRDYLKKAMSLSDSRLFAAITESGQIVALGGIWRFSYVFGEWGLYLLDGSENYLLSIYRACWQLIDREAREMGIWRLCALVLAGHEKNSRFCRAFGFEPVTGPEGVNTIEVEGSKAELFMREVA